MKILKSTCMAIALAQFGIVGASAGLLQSPLQLANVQTQNPPTILAHGGKHKHLHCHKRRKGVLCHRHWHKRHRHHA